MRLVLDANVLFPTVMREVLLGAAAAGTFAPLWSDRILEEWVRASRRLGDQAEDIARAEAALIAATWPSARVEAQDIPGLSLPDADDIHVLATAVAAGADGIVTRNARDFPRQALAEHGLARLDPDGFLVGCADEPGVADAAEAARQKAAQISGQQTALRPLLKRAGLPRLGRRLG